MFVCRFIVIIGYPAYVVGFAVYTVGKGSRQTGFRTPMEGISY